MSQSKQLCAALIILSNLSLWGCAGHTTAPRGTVAVQTDRARVAIIFSDNDRAEVRRYYRKHLPPGLAKRETLPPGLRKQLVKRGTLPPGLRSAQLPAELEHRLSRLPAGYVRLRVATDVLLLDEHTRVILDVITDINN